MLVDERGELVGGADGVAVVVHAVGVVGGWQEADAFVEGVQVAVIQVDVFLGADHVSMSIGLETRLTGYGCGLTYLGFIRLAGRCGPGGIGSGLFPSLVLDCPASRTNLFRTLVVKPSRRSAIRRHRWTSSTTLVRSALIVRSRSTRDAITSFSLAPTAKDYILVTMCTCRGFHINVLAYLQEEHRS